MTKRIGGNMSMVGTDLSRPCRHSQLPQGRDKSVPTDIRTKLLKSIIRVPTTMRATQAAFRVPSLPHAYGSSDVE